MRSSFPCRAALFRCLASGCAAACAATAQSAAALPELKQLPSDTPCFPIARVELVGAHAAALPWLQRELDAVRGQCVGAAGLRAIKRVLDSRLLERGYTTSRIGFDAQNLAGGVLHVRLHAGVVDALRIDADVPPGWGAIFAQPLGAPFELRRLEQGLELADRLPSQRVHVRIEPAAAPGGSVVIVERAPGSRRRLHGALRTDNGADAAQGRLRQIVALALDQPSWHNDQLTLLASTTVRGLGPAQRAQSVALGYSVPWHGVLLDAAATTQRVGQTVQARHVRFVSSAAVEQWRVQTQWPLWRGAATRWNGHAALSRQRTRGWLQDTELAVQRRDSRVVEIGTDALQLSAAGSLGWQLALREGVGAPGAGLARAQALRTQVQTARRAGPWSWRLAASAQLGRHGMAPEERFVPMLHGFDANRPSSGDSGVLLQHELARALPQFGGWATAAFATVDVARLSGMRGALAGAALGLDMRRGKVGLELTLGAPLRQQNAVRDTLLRASATFQF